MKTANSIASTLLVLAALVAPACQGPGARADLVAIYALDEREQGGDVHVSLKHEDIAGEARFSQTTKIYYVTPAVAAQLTTNPELIDVLIPASGK